MTSSLVGSEMCIRDRQGRCPSPSTGNSAQWREPRPDGVQPLPLRQMPVSYTHLTLPTICSV
eukprot:1721021-Prorocentrum_lima.AAC.1